MTIATFADFRPDPFEDVVGPSVIGRLDGRWGIVAPTASAHPYQ